MGSVRRSREILSATDDEKSKGNQGRGMQMT